MSRTYTTLFAYILLAALSNVATLYPQGNPYRTDSRLSARIDITSNIGVFKVVAPRANSEQTVIALRKAIDLVERFLIRSGVTIQRSDEINLTLLDSNVNHLDLPERLKRLCHPGWMSPGAGIFVVKRRVEECVDGNDFVHKLHKVLVHEIGHLVLWYLNRSIFSLLELNEGFATWFEHVVLGDELPISKESCSAGSSASMGDFWGYVNAALHYWGMSPREVFNLLRLGEIEKLQKNYTKVKAKVCKSYR